MWHHKGSTDSHSHLQFYCLLHVLRQLKKYMKKDNLNTTHQNITFPDS